jgi:hypothetical protein
MLRPVCPCLHPPETTDSTATCDNSSEFRVRGLTHLNTRKPWVATDQHIYCD